MYVPKSPLQTSKESQSQYLEYGPLLDFKGSNVNFVFVVELIRSIQIELSSSNLEKENDKKDDICQKPKIDEDDFIIENFETGFNYSLEAIMGIENFIRVISVLPLEYE